MRREASALKIARRKWDPASVSGNGVFKRLNKKPSKYRKAPALSFYDVIADITIPVANYKIADRFIISEIFGKAVHIEGDAERLRRHLGGRFKVFDDEDIDG